MFGYDKIKARYHQLWCRLPLTNRHANSDHKDFQTSKQLQIGKLSVEEVEVNKEGWSGIYGEEDTKGLPSQASSFLFF